MGIRLRVGATVAVLGMALGQMALADVLVSSTVEFTGLNFSVSADVAGVTPSFSVSNPGFLLATLPSDSGDTLKSQRQFLDGELWPSLVQQQTLGQGAIEYKSTADGMSLALNLSSEQVQQLVQGAMSRTGSLILGLVGESTANPPRFTLSPHSRVTLSGQVNVNASWDASLVNGLLSSLSNPQLPMSASLDAAWDMGFTREGDLSSLQPLAYDNHFDFAFIYADPFAVLQPGMVSQFSDKRAFSLTLVNDQDVELTGTYQLSMLNIFSVNNPVPEPATWALMGLGLAALAGAAQLRRRHRLS